MAKVDATVRRETGYVALWVLLFSALLQAAFLLIGQWTPPVLWGNLLSGTAAVGNFFLMGLTVQKALTQDEKQAANTMRLSQTGRLFLLFLIAMIGVLLPRAFSLWTVLIPLLFPRIAIALRPLFNKDNK